MIAKCLQNLANLVEFGGKEPYMEVVNPFILKNKERMMVFLDHLSVWLMSYIRPSCVHIRLFLSIFAYLTERQGKTGTGRGSATAMRSSPGHVQPSSHLRFQLQGAPGYESHECRHFIHVFSISDMHFNNTFLNLRFSLLLLQATLKKVLTVTEMLSKHKQKYKEMIRT